MLLSTTRAIVFREYHEVERCGSTCLLSHFSCSDEALDMEDCRRQRSESSTADDVSHATHIAVSYIDKHYPQYKSVSNSRKRLHQQE